ncbi:MAG: CPBP family intramembrane metalloprotease [Sporocytophaga sp.]|uniref:CPBP family intramembrane glutamic endopeptidase n=1 Tax=Sporocytophaga sp. TaxID=2231183 RepID=UPI001B2B8D39|nr:CPBP family intramembrane glutamic endopeptidase [Sporocytophaga sp.]MBO9700061.1 CPBP family intramembrane metalloprotease [Sporocytophaga sp.]
MTNFKFKLWLTLTIIGLAGVASLLLSDLPLENLPAEVMEKIPLETLRFLILINPTILVLIATGIGTILYERVNLSLPLLQKILDKRVNTSLDLKGIVVQGCLLGVLAGVSIVAIAYFFSPFLPKILIESNANIKLSLITKLLYGGITEELLCRFGLMTLFVWILFKIFRKLNTAVYWIAIVLSAIVFSLGHLPLVSRLINDLSFSVYAYIILANSIGGLFFGYAYWKRGLECAFIAHAFAHLIMVGLNLVGG